MSAPFIATDLSDSVWNAIYEAIRRESAAGLVQQAVVTARNQEAGTIKCASITSEDIPVVGQHTHLHYYQGNQLKGTFLHTHVPDIGEEVLLVQTRTASWRCLGIVGEQRWEPDAPLGMIPPDSITSAELAPDSVGSSEIQADSVGASEIAPTSITDAEIALGTIEGRRINWHEGSSPPVSPSEGDVWIYHPVAGKSWYFRYDPTENASYPWQFIGGPPISVFADSGETSAGGGFRPAAAPELALPRAGRYSVSYSCRVVQGPNANTSTGWDMYLGYRLGAGAWTLWGDTYQAFYFGTQSYANGVTWAATLGIQNVEGEWGSPDYRLRMHAAGLLNWDFTVGQRSISAIPVRVA